LRPQVTDEEEGVTTSRVTAWVVLAVAVAALALMALPAAVALRPTPNDGAAMAAIAAGLAVVTGGVKLAAVLWGLGAGAVGSFEPRAVAAGIQ
jgi:hypothetical protein